MDHKQNNFYVDVAKAHLDIYCMTELSAMRFINHPNGSGKLIKCVLNKSKQLSNPVAVTNSI